MILYKNRCPLECFSVRYQIETNNQLNSNSDNSTATISIYYEEFVSTERKQIPKMTVLDLFSSVGGFLGLVLGASLLSFLEIAELVFWMVIICLKHLLRKLSMKNRLNVNK